MKKVLFIGDIHGRTDWITYAEEAIKAGTDVVFLADYYDSFYQNGYAIEENLRRIIAFKKKADHRKTKVVVRPDVTLLLGNHDYAYMMGKNATSGFDSTYDHSHRELLSKNWHLFDLAWGYENRMTGKYTLATHAGITNEFWAMVRGNYSPFLEKIVHDPWKVSNMHKTINALKDMFTPLWEIGRLRGGDGTPGILWADIKELVQDPFPSINQVVGHSAWHNPELFFNKDGTFIAKVDSFGKDVTRLIINL